jgi:hypothetical protein
MRSSISLLGSGTTRPDSSRVAGAAEEVVNDHRKPKHRLVKIALPVVAAGAAAVAAAASGIIDKPKDKAKSVAEKTRDELYELAKKADIPGRSGMSKEELAKALAK